MTANTKVKLENLINSIKSNKVTVKTEAYSPVWEGTIQQAVAYKRNGDYDKSIEIYIDLFGEMDCVNSNIVAFLYKAVICAEEFYLAYYLLSLVEIIVIAKDGPKMPIVPFPGGPVMGYIKWAHTEYREELEEACKNTLTYRNTDYLLKYVQPKSGNPSYRFKKSDSQIFDEIKRLFS